MKRTEITWIVIVCILDQLFHVSKQNFKMKYRRELTILNQNIWNVSSKQKLLSGRWNLVLKQFTFQHLVLVIVHQLLRTARTYSATASKLLLYLISNRLLCWSRQRSPNEIQLLSPIKLYFQWRCMNCSTILGCIGIEGFRLESRSHKSNQREETSERS